MNLFKHLIKALPWRRGNGIRGSAHQERPKPARPEPRKSGGDRLRRHMGHKWFLFIQARNARRRHNKRLAIARAHA